MKAMREGLLILLGISPAIGGMLLYNQLPETVASHFGVHNEVNGTMSRGSLIIMLLLLGFVPAIIRMARSIDPKRANYEQFSKAFEISRIGITVLLAVVGWTLIAYNLGWHIEMSKIVMIAIGLLFSIMGNYLTQVKPNYTFGIRTPWTLANEEVWRKTHRLGGPLMMLGGIVALITAFLSGIAAVIAFLSAIFLAAVIPVVYSYVLYARFKAR